MHCWLDSNLLYPLKVLFTPTPQPQMSWLVVMPRHEEQLQVVQAYPALHMRPALGTAQRRVRPARLSRDDLERAEQGREEQHRSRGDHGLEEGLLTKKKHKKSRMEQYTASLVDVSGTQSGQAELPASIPGDLFGPQRIKMRQSRHRRHMSRHMCMLVCSSLTKTGRQSQATQVTSLYTDAALRMCIDAVCGQPTVAGVHCGHT